ncbi:MAG: aspartate--tRNA ligase [Clostridia bacterium]|nr:aspartate--tRNA ligase [Clostridia bacterium]
MTRLNRTKMCGEFNAQDIGKEVAICGWIAKYRNLGSLFFADLRDRTGIVQFSISDNAELMEIASTIRNEYVVYVKGTVVSRGTNVNKNIPTGEIEIIANEIEILSVAETTPFVISDDANAGEALRLKYRYLDLRRPSLLNNLLMRDKISKIARDFLANEGFIDVETPILGKSTPEGARDYLVPSRVHPGEFYALPQSPQLFKQLLMIAGVDRYYQIARCFRDEDLRANRQPEFTQIDIEMSFIRDENDVMDVTEDLIKDIFNKAIGYQFDGKFRRMTYKEAMSRYGSDKPDTRFGLELKDISNIVKNSTFAVFANALSIGGVNHGMVQAINAKGFADKMSRKDIDAVGEVVKTFGAKGVAWIALRPDQTSSSFLKYLTDEERDAIYEAMGAETGDVIFVIADKRDVTYKVLGELRLYLANKYNIYDKSIYDVLWITEFPLLEWSDEENRFMSVHHPFTMPYEEDLQYIDTDPERVRSRAYDLVINGQEAGGGSVRIHRRDMQQKMFEVLGLTEDVINARFGYFVDAFRYGAPPHAGLAFGLDRLVMLLTNTDSIKDVIAFPKVQNASCLMSDAPNVVDTKQLDELNINIKTVE